MTCFVGIHVAFHIVCCTSLNVKIYESKLHALYTRTHTEVRDSGLGFFVTLLKTGTIFAVFHSVGILP